MLKRLLTLATLTILVVTPMTQTNAMTLQELIDAEEQWLAGQQLPSGAIPMNRSSERMVPYFTNLGLMGLVDNPAYAETVRSWMMWYVDHLNDPDVHGLRGTVYDYQMRYGQERATADYDSSDSYAATFLSLVRAYYDTTGDGDFVRGLEIQLRLVAQAIYGTVDPTDGLTYAKPNYRIKYLMDNAEVYLGLLDWAYLLENVLDDPVEASTTREQAEATRNSTLAMWQSDIFSYAKDERGSLFGTSWGKWYPDATAQLFPIWSGVLDPADPQARQLWDRFNKEHPEWLNHGHPDAFPWTVAGYVAVLMGDWDRAQTYIDTIHQRYGMTGRNWPWHVGESGWYLRTLKEMTDR